MAKKTPATEPTTTAQLHSENVKKDTKAEAKENGKPEAKTNPYDEFLQKSLAEYKKLNDHLAGSMPPPFKSSVFQNEILEAMKLQMARIADKPEDWLKMQNEFVATQTQLWMNFINRVYGGGEPEEIVQPPQGDRRFSGKAWSENPVFDYLKQSYLLTSHLMKETLEKYPLDEENQRKLSYQTRQFIDAISPSNFPATNPEVINKAIETRGKSLFQGMANLLEDMNKGRVTMTDEKKFKVGQNIAVTPGSVVFENPLFQLIQYTPTTEEVYELPLLIIPPWINKFYILDLAPDNSLIKFAVEAGHTVFVVSWRNIPAEMGNTSWEDYISMGSLTAMDVVRKIVGTPKLNVVGYCVGGTLLSCTLSILKTRKQDIIASATFFTAMIDFSYAGEISVFVDEAQMQEREKEYNTGGIFGGNQMANAFAFLRANDLVWNYVVNNYLLGKEYIPFDLLYWNGDPTNLPANMYLYYLRNMYLENNLGKPNKLTMLGEKIDVTQIDLPVLSVSAKEDHIAPWLTVYKGAKLLKGPVEFVLGASGHIAGIINPASKNKREYWTSGEMTGTAEHWLETAKNYKGSWWTYWAKWVEKFGGKKVPARTTLGSKDYPPIEPAPGRYVVEPVPTSGLSL